MGLFEIPTNERTKSELVRFYEQASSQDMLIMDSALYAPDKTDDELQAFYNNFFVDIEHNILQKARSEMSSAFSVKAYSYIEEKYPTYRQQMLQALYSQAIKNGLTNRAAYIERLIDWCSSVVALSLQADAELAECSTEEEMFLVDVDYTAMDYTDPEVTIEQALSIND
tara:strand:- start:1293 stop:1799 length:507 start_codon:yes stop_codon:yes gene_type:complete